MVVYMGSHLGHFSIYSIGQYAKQNDIHVVTLPNDLFAVWMAGMHIPTKKGSTLVNIVKGYTSGRVKNVLIFGAPYSNDDIERYSISTFRYLAERLGQEVRLIACNPETLEVVTSPPIKMHTLTPELLVREFNDILLGSNESRKVYTLPIEYPPPNIRAIHPDSIWVRTPGSWRYRRSDRIRVAALASVAVLLILGLVAVSVLTSWYVKGIPFQKPNVMSTVF
jgi:hypothetical protein